MILQNKGKHKKEATTEFQVKTDRGQNVHGDGDRRPGSSHAGSLEKVHLDGSRRRRAPKRNTRDDWGGGGRAEIKVQY